MQLFPNPATDALVALGDFGDDQRVTVAWYTLTGQRVHQTTVMPEGLPEGQRVVLNVGEFDPGTYLLRIGSQSRLVQVY